MNTEIVKVNGQDQRVPTPPVEQQGMVRHEGERLTNVQRLGSLLAASGYFSDAREMAQAAVKVMAGEELGIPPIAAMMGISIIKGKVALSGNLIASRIRAHGYDYKHKRFDSAGCVLEFFSKVEGGKRTMLGESSFTEEDAKQAQILGDMYKKYPRNMYFNRAISNGAKWYCPEVFAGAPVYTPEELGAAVDEQGDYVAPAQPAFTASAKEPSTPAPEPAPKAADAKQAVADKTDPSPEVVRADPGLESFLRSMTGFKEIVAGLGEAKAELAGLTGADDRYYEILALFKMRHANEFGTLKNARACGASLYREIMSLKEKQAGSTDGQVGAAGEGA